MISARKSLRISAETFFFLKSPAFGRKICDFGQKKPSDFGEDSFFFFFWRSPAFGRKICDFSQKKPSHFDGNLCPPDFNFAPRSREAGDAPGCEQLSTCLNKGVRKGGVLGVQTPPLVCRLKRTIKKISRF